jgi:hypothetical protein
MIACCMNGEMSRRGTSLRYSSYISAIWVLPSDAMIRLICGELKSLSSLGSFANVWPPAFAARPDMATAGKAAAATTTPARRPQIRSEVALAKML